ncbi:MAG: putative aminopeptidase YsdC [Herpetosiphonaceae bacterium]|nr:MAG: putative aminopeptidase YsdC [Herpetosiphonaceae bacterium]
MDETLQLMKALTEAPGVPGYETAVREVMRRALSEIAEVSTDHLGSIIGRKVGYADGPKIMLAGHMDEVGFMVTRITDDGFLKFQALGGWWEQVMLAQRVTVETRKGPIIGVIGSKPPHLLPAETRKEVMKKDEMYIDIGAGSREEAEAFGVRPGDPVVPICPFTVMKNEKLLMAKAWDNRFGCALAVEVLRRLKGTEHPNIVYGVGTVQEEVGLRGAQTSAFAIQPDVAFALDVGIAGDTPGIKVDEAQSRLGKGPVILLYDASLIPSRKLRDLVIDTAEANGIPYQFDSIPMGGTDAGRFHVTGKGVPSLAFGIPARYIHTHASIIHRDDFENAAKLLVEVVKRLDQAAVEDLRDG